MRRRWTVGRVLVTVALVLLAYVLALPIGWNREKEERSAGLRTFPLVAVAACGFFQAAETMVGDSPEATARVVEGLITGMGFVKAFLGSLAFIPGDVLKAVIAALAGRAVMAGYPLLPQRA